MSEHDLSLAKKGDPAAFERLVTPYLKGLYGFIAKRVSDQAEDVYQETLLGAWRAMPGFREGSTVKTWLYAIAGYKCTDAIRKKASSPILDELDEQTGTQGFEDSSVNTMDIRNAMRSFHHEDQTLLYLLYHQCFTQKEAAMMLDIPEGTVKSRLNRLKRQLKDHISGGANHEP